MRILISGGAGFVGSSLARAFRGDGHEVVAFDNLRRRGSELNLAAFKAEGIGFQHGDVRVAADWADLPGDYDLVIDAAAEPSVHAGTAGGSPRYVLDTNLVGTLNCLEFCSRRAPRLLFLSTSRVYSIAPLQALDRREGEARFELTAQGRGVSPRGIAEDFAVDQPRSFYGASKLASELLVQEYAAAGRVAAVIDRCGVIAGPGQFGKVDQGVFTLWVARHLLGGALAYHGYGGSGKQVRDLLHPADLYDLLQRQVANLEDHSGAVFNVGGGLECSTSLLEYTGHCQAATGNTIEMGRVPETNPVDVPLYLSDNTKVERAFGWTPQRGVGDIVSDIVAWIRGDLDRLAPLFGGAGPKAGS